eukprot:1148863-Pelagomonas_calceolata.AAC.6
MHGESVNAGNFMLQGVPLRSDTLISTKLTREMRKAEWQASNTAGFRLLDSTVLTSPTKCKPATLGGRTTAACNLISAKAVTLHIILLGVGGTCHTEHTLNQFKELGLDHQHAIKLAHKLHAHSVQYAQLVTTRRAVENSNTCHSQFLEPGASSNPPDPH